MPVQTSSQPTPTLRQFMEQVKSWNFHNKMWPYEIAPAQEYINNTRKDILPHLPTVHRAAFELILRRCDRNVDRSLSGIASKFMGLDRDERAFGESKGTTQPFYATEAWAVCKPWMLKKSGPQALYGLARKMRMKVLREALYTDQLSDALTDIYTTIFDLHQSVPNHSDKLINPFDDWSVAVFNRRAEMPNDENVFRKFQALVSSLDWSTDNGGRALAAAVKFVDKSEIAWARVRALEKVDMLLSCGVPWKESFETFPHPVQEHIKNHPVYRKEQLRKISTSAALPQSQSTSSRRPAL